MMTELMMNGAWECECDEGFVQPVTVEDCLICKFRKDDAPDARVEDLNTFGKYAINCSIAYKGWASSKNRAGPKRLSDLLSF